MLFDQDLRIPQSISNFSSKVLRALALTSALSLVSISGLASADTGTGTGTGTDKDTDREAIKQFQLETTPLTERARQLSRRHREQMETFSNKLDQYQDARPLLQDALIGEMALTANKMLTLTNEYLPRYRAFLTRIDKNSSCYQPKRLEQFQQTRDEVQDYLNQLQGLTQTQELGEAYAALMAINIGQSRAAVLVNLLETSKLCYVTQAMPAAAQDILLLEGLMAERLPEIVETANLSASEPEGPSLNEPSLNEPKLNRPELNEPTHNGSEPKSNDASRSDANAAGTILGDSITKGSSPVDSEAFNQREEKTTPKQPDLQGNTLDACIDQQVSQLGLTSAQALTVLSCRLSSDSVSLKALSKLSNLEILSLQGGALADLSALAGLSHLSLLNIEQSQITNFGDLKALKGNLSFNEVDSQDWQALANAQAESIAIMSPTRCDALKPLANQPNVALLYKGLSPQAMADLMQRQASMQGLTIMTDCPAP
ncbi:hypothetical protein K0J45_03225 [Shewanella alkalitolerans]|uniref:hypothetical protein n=1 Tax=Shewanella alkalitolerans TaxID=2864209 RepID=UPI001C66024D|nr:hypothetical protein [Shewanella alkalitolerans]QYJ98266.1 hypothetical protein K0J45_03225 [Shewanella alkalitolerans]